MFLYGCITDGVTVLLYFLVFKGKIFIPLWIGFLITAFTLFSVCCIKKQQTIMTWNPYNGLLLGFVQALALMPGISRFGTTFVAARWLGFSARKAFQLSFLIEFPISIAAALQGTIFLYRNNMLSELLHLQMILIMIIATASAMLGLLLMRYCIMREKMRVFAWYVLVVTFLAALF